jgi:tRNA-dihydrouridine synthase
VPIFVKCRLRENIMETLEFVRLMEASGASGIAVHARKRAQRTHTGQPDWDSLKIIKESVSIPVIANGGEGGRSRVV